MFGYYISYDSYARYYYAPDYVITHERDTQH